VSRPDASELPAHARVYVGLVPGDDVRSTLAESTAPPLLSGGDDSWAGTFASASGKWTVKGVSVRGLADRIVGHELHRVRILPEATAVAAACGRRPGCQGLDPGALARQRSTSAESRSSPVTCPGETPSGRYGARVPGPQQTSGASGPGASRKQAAGAARRCGRKRTARDCARSSAGWLDEQSAARRHIRPAEQVPPRRGAKPAGEGGLATDPTFRKRLQQGEVVVGPLTGVPSVQLVDMLALADYDFVMLDCEHGPVDDQDLESLCRVIRLRGKAPLCRVRDQHPKSILRALDAGALGVMIPGVEDAQAAREVAAACRYAPEGSRGLFAGTAANDWGAAPTAAYMRDANASVVCIVQVESGRSVDNAAAIAAVPGVDGIVIGPGDLSQSLGHPGQPDHPEVQAAVARAIAAARQAGRWAGTVATPATAPRLRQLGAQLFLVVATALISQALRANAQAIRDAVAPASH
jgi:4-hydroxy-2-oxoheptanedioate aldolase